MCRDLAVQPVAEKTGLSAHTLRDSERVNLIPSIERATNGNRRYSRGDHRRIEFVKRLQATGAPVGDAQDCLRTYDRGDADVAERLEIMETHRRRLKAKVEELGSFRAEIEAKVESCRERVAQQEAATRLEQGSHPDSRASSTRSTAKRRPLPCHRTGAAEQAESTARKGFR